MKKYALCAILVFICFSSGALEEYSDGRIKLVLDDSIGKFHLYYMTDVEKKVYEPLFWDKDKRTSYLSAFIDGKIYVLGESPSFRTRIRGTQSKPAFVFESKELRITAEFSFIRTASSGVSNGARIDYTVENWGPKSANAGLSLLIDTFLGEKAAPNFRTDLRPIENETIINRTTADQWWLSRGNRYGLMGSVFVPGLESPDFVYFANWKRLNESRWKPEYVSGRNFNSLPFSVKDSAVCYFMDVGRIERWQKRQMTILLAAEDIYGFDYNKVNVTPSYPPPEEREESVPAAIIVTPPITVRPQEQPAPVQNLAQAVQQTTTPPPNVQQQTVMPAVRLPIGPLRVDLQTLRELIAKVDGYIYFGTSLTEAELRALEALIQQLKFKYGSIF
ncbi:MAG: hypothetical protein LBC53_05135 [Spirochaetaceae bacterium]|nr:hypothetical protein [Spirochaetaceae bacterium]